MFFLEDAIGSTPYTVERFSVGLKKFVPLDRPVEMSGLCLSGQFIDLVY